MVRIRLDRIFVSWCILVLISVTESTAVAQYAGGPQRVTLADAIKTAQFSEASFVSAQAAQRSASIDTYLAKAALLPNVTYHNEVLYTQPNRLTTSTGQGNSEPGFVFIANNAVREYASQASVNEKFGVKQLADVSVARANAAKLTAELEIARRGLVSTVVSLYYSVSATETKQKLLGQAFTEAQAFTDQTQKREAAREVAHADVVKALLQQQQKQRDLSDAVVAASKARLELAVLLFPDPRTPYVIDLPSELPPLPTRDQVNRLASQNNPEIRSAIAGIEAARAEVKSAKAAYLPDVGLNFSYGIDAPQFAKNGPDGARNLGYSMSGTLDIPVFDWFSTQKKIKQSELRHTVAAVTLTAAQRHLVADLEESYAEASAARDQLILLVQSVQTATESLQLTNLRYQAGESTALEVVDAQNALLNAQTAQADGGVRYETALSALQVLTGTL